MRKDTPSAYVHAPVGVVSATVEVEFACPECAEEVREGVLVRSSGTEKFRPMHAECLEELDFSPEEVETLTFSVRAPLT